MDNSIEQNPDLILNMHGLTDEIVSKALDNGYKPQKEHFSVNPELKEFNSVLLKAFEDDPSVIIYFNKDLLTFTHCLSATKRGYIADESDFIQNSELWHYSIIVKPALEKNPSIIRLLPHNAHVFTDIIERALSQYEITIDDLNNNPDLTKISAVIDKYPQYKLYSTLLEDEEKQEYIKEYLKGGSVLSTNELPFLDEKFGAKADISKLNELIDLLKISIDENNVNEQQNYYHILDQVLDGIANVRYLSSRNQLEYPNMVSLNDKVLDLFANVFSTQNTDLILQFTEKLSHVIGHILSDDFIKSELDRLYNIYSLKQSIDLFTTFDFYVKILNEQRNYVLSTIKSSLLKELESKMSLSEKKKSNILIGKKLDIVKSLISSNAFSQLGISENSFSIEIENAITTIQSNKDIKKKNIQIDTNKLNDLADVFRNNGYLNTDNIARILEIDDSEVQKFIINCFERIKLKLINNVKLSENDPVITDNDKKSLGTLNYANYKIYDNNRYLENLSELLVKLDNATLDKILDNKDSIAEIASLLPLINLVEEFDMNTFINILSNLNRIKSKMLTSYHIELPNSIDLITKKFSDVIYLANAYSSIDDITLFALGKDIANEVGDQFSNQYLDFYLKMLNHQNSNIPPVSMQTQNYTLQSGISADPERLLIGKRTSGHSCIDLLNSAGQQTYSEVLLEKTGDVILVRDNDNNLISRIMLFRRGNVVQMITNGNNKYSIDLFSDVAKQIMEQSMATNDNIDYIFVGCQCVDDTDSSYWKKCIIVTDTRFIYSFPHADFGINAYLLASKETVLDNNPSNLNMDFEITPKATYPTLRKKIFYSPSEEEITRLRALSIVMETDKIQKENRSREFEPFYLKEYVKVVCGEDWYIAQKKDGTIEQIVLPTNDPRKYSEIEQANQIMNMPTNDNRTL